MGKCSFLILGTLATIAFQEVFTLQPGPCRKLVQSYPPTTIKGKMIHHSLYLDIFTKGEKKQNKPLNVCLHVDFQESFLKGYTVIGTDNKDFAVLYKCNYFDDSKSNVELINTYTRLKTPSKDTLTLISQAFKKNGLKENSELIFCQ
ncbi:uncharacterized protein LOC108038841 [Drosophila rhopaloa]|uniref:Uncharacterized protein n=1 Tax=Drosophila rhopaloa TaxID=1041015 RepID=A0ABM5JFG3_DRORH|nr:uncharacterized protein LOC108038841 [Drosophila rhopaloa]